MNRQHRLAIAVLALLIGNVLWYVWSHWGLITIHSENKPLAEIIRSIEKQGRVTVKTDLDTSVPVRMHVDKVKLAEALETLGTLTDSRWRLTYLVAPDKAGIASAMGSLTAGQRAEGWKSLFMPVPPVLGEPDVPPDPRADPWTVKPAEEQKLQSYLQQASRTVSASFVFPESWNPDISAPPKSGPIAKALPRLAKAAHGQYQEVFFLRRSGRRGPGPDDDGLRRASFDGDDRDRMRGAFEERMQAEIDKLPPAERAVAQQEHDERRKMFEGLRDMTPEQRAAKFQELMNNEAMAERREKAESASDARRSPQQKLQRARDYIDRKQQAKARSAGGAGTGR